MYEKDNILSVGRVLSAQLPHSEVCGTLHSNKTVRGARVTSAGQFVYFNNSTEMGDIYHCCRRSFKFVNSFCELSCVSSVTRYL